MDVAVLGAGATGRTVARLCLCSGHPVTIHSHDATIVMDSVDIIERDIDADSVDESTQAVLDRLEPTTGLEAAVSGAEIVVETTLDDASALQERFAELEEVTARDTLVASAVESVSVTAGAAGLRYPDRALGLLVSGDDHPLVEVVVADQTDERALSKARSFADSLDATAVTIRDSPGGGATRLALALELEAMRMVDAGVAGVEAVDTIVTRDSKRGPLERADRAGLDNRLATLQALAADLGPRFDPPPILRERVETGKTGVDAGEGFYVWEGDEPTESALPDPTDLGEQTGRGGPDPGER